MIFDCLQLVNFAVLDCLLCTHDFFSHRQARHFDERRTTFYHGKRLFVECHDEQQNLDLLFRNRIHVDFVKCILLQKAVLYHFCNGEDEAVGVRKRIRSDKAHNLLETLFALKEGWKEFGFNDKSWQKVVVTDYRAKLASQQEGAITVREELPPVKVFKNKLGWMYDLGQNASGIFRIKVKGPRGSKIVLKPCEVLPSDSICRQTGTYEGGMQYYTYTCSGDSEEIWYPQFSYYGFRYIQVEGATPLSEHAKGNLPVVMDLKGLHTCNEAAEAGTFVCSKQLFNKIHTLVDWAMRSNMQSVITDCPQREKLGWQEQDHLVQCALQYRYNMAPI